MKKKGGSWAQGRRRRRTLGGRSKERASGGRLKYFWQRPAETIVNLDYRGQFPVGVAHAARVARTFGVREQASVGRHPGPRPTPRSISPPQSAPRPITTDGTWTPLSAAPARPLYGHHLPVFGYPHWLHAPPARTFRLGQGAGRNARQRSRESAVDGSGSGTVTCGPFPGKMPEVGCLATSAD